MGEILGIGIEELIFIGILLALLFGPESIPRIARGAGKLLNRLFRSPLYREGQHIRKQIRDLPSALARLAELEEIQKNLNDEIRDLKQSIDPGLDKITLPPEPASESPPIEPPTPPDAPASSDAHARSDESDR